MPRYAWYALLACVLGACLGEEQGETTIDAGTRCVCKPTMTLESGAGTGTPLCNNASMDWLVQTMMGELSFLHDQLESKQTDLNRLSSEMKQKDGVIQSLETEISDKLRKIQQANKRQKELVDENQTDLNRLSSEMQQKDGVIQSQKTEISDQLQKLQQADERQKELVDENQKLRQEVEWLTVSHAKVHVRPKDCADVQNYGFHYSGVYSINPSRASDYSRDGMEVFCDLNTDGGGWTVFQRRQDGSTDFAQDWEAYKHGFGKIAREFWLGNDQLFYILKQRTYELRVDLTDFKGNMYHASYKIFGMDNEDSSYRLHVGEYSGTAGDALKHHNGAPFTTIDRDNDESKTANCAKKFGGGGWWYKRCYDSNLNGIYDNRHLYETIVWYQLRNNHEPMRHVEMKIRPVGFSEEEL